MLKQNALGAEKKVKSFTFVRTLKGGAMFAIQANREPCRDTKSICFEILSSQEVYTSTTKALSDGSSLEILPIPALSEKLIKL